MAEAPSDIGTAPLKFIVPTEYEVTPQQIEDLLITAFEEGIAHWALVFKKPEQPYWDATLVDAEDPDANGVGTRHRLTLLGVVEGIKRCAHDYPKHFKDFMNGNADATTADVIVQCTVFGEVVYG